jgi:cytochrome c oxidase cbb3-type subunit 1
VIRATGGLLFLIGSLIMVYNLVRTVRGELRSEAAFEGPRAAVAPSAAE